MLFPVDHTSQANAASIDGLTRAIKTISGFKLQKKKKKKVPSQKGSVQRKKKMAETVESIQSSFFERTEQTRQQHLAI